MRDPFHAAGARRAVGLRGLVQAGCALALASAVGAAAADAVDAPAAAPRWHAFAEGGATSGTRSARLGVGDDWPWRWRFGTTLLTGYTEASYGRWFVERAQRDGWAGFTHVAVTPVLRLWAAPDMEGLFGELGVGADVIAPHYKTTTTEFGSVFNFGDHVGIGWRLPGAGALEASLRYEHFSDAHLKEPNPGKNFVQLRVGFGF